MFKFVVSMALCASLASPALAAGADRPTRTARVSYVDLDLTKAEGRATLDRRLRHAARTVCPVMDRSSLTERYAVRACVLRTRAAARQDAALAVVRAQQQLALENER